MAVAAHVVLVPPRNNCERIFPSQSKRFKPLPIRPRPRQPQDLMQKGSSQSKPSIVVAKKTLLELRNPTKHIEASRRRREAVQLALEKWRPEWQDVSILVDPRGWSCWGGLAVQAKDPLRCFLPSSCRLMRGTWTEKLAVSCALATPPQASK